ncbi:MAG: ribonucleotide-diphosphate reductase subunit beta [Solirubrobacterales bacterium]
MNPPIQLTNAGEPQIAADQIDYVDLYARWEAGNWSAMELDFTQDKVDWNETFDDFMRKAARWSYSLFFFGEDEVADQLSPFIDAAPLEEHKYFLTTQQVDEARHAIFFSRFFKEVIGAGGASYADRLKAADPDLTYGIKKVFETLGRVTDRMRAGDHSTTTLAQAVTLYHFVVEGTLAQTGQHFIADYLERMDALPGFRAGMVNVEKDEQRHIAFGVKLLADLNRQDPKVRPAVREILSEVMPYTVGVFRPPDDDERYIEVFGETLVGVAVTGARQLEMRLTAAGFDCYGPDGVLPFLDPERSHAERAERAFCMQRAGFFSGGTEPVKNDPQALAYYFDLTAAAVSPDNKLKAPTTFAWDFADADPWSIKVENGVGTPSAGLPADPDVTFRTDLATWIGITAGHVNPARALITRKLRIKGRPATLAKLPGVFQTD